LAPDMLLRWSRLLRNVHFFVSLVTLARAHDVPDQAEKHDDGEVRIASAEDALDAALDPEPNCPRAKNHVALGAFAAPRPCRTGNYALRADELAALAACQRGVDFGVLVANGFGLGLRFGNEAAHLGKASAAPGA